MHCLPHALPRALSSFIAQFHFSALAFPGWVETPRRGPPPPPLDSAPRIQRDPPPLAPPFTSSPGYCTALQRDLVSQVGDLSLAPTFNAHEWAVPLEAYDHSRQLSDELAVLSTSTDK